ncbi:MerR family transcriptional regulator [Candidatus Kapabacteria bacterium]|nr:MerR family transcriptional regulator [Candidatus Kapabacteria bacterium]
MQKLYYSISEISDVLNEEQHILRYWEKEFKSLRPRKNTAGNRKYSNKDLKILKKIKDLIRVEKLTIGVAKDIIDKNIPFDGIKQQQVNFTQNKQNKDIIEIDKSTVKNLLEVLKEISDILKS